MSASDFAQAPPQRSKRLRAYWQTPFPAERIDRRLCLVLAGLSMLLACRRIWAGGFGWSDAPLHAMDGIFLADAFRAWPTADPVGWAEQYYGRLPCLGFVVYWPPGFACLEGALFLLTGPSVIAARALVAACFAASVVLAYALGRRLAGRAGAIAAAVLLMSAPFGLDWSRQVMLEWPAAMWVMLAAYLAVRFVDEPTWPLGLLAGLAVFAAYMTKQQAGHVALLVVAMPIIRADRFTAVPWLKIFLPAGAGLAAIAYYHKLVSPCAKLASYLTAGETHWRHLLDPAAWLHYPLRIGQIVGPVTLTLAVLGIVGLVLARRRGLLLLLLVWLGAAYLACTIPAWKELRYGFWLLLPAAMLAGAGLVSALPGKARYAAVAAALLGGAFQVSKDLSRPVYRLSDYSDAVRWLSLQGDADVVLIDGLREGQFVWDLRRDPPAAARILPLRASKVLYSWAARRRWMYSEYVKSEQDIVELLSRFGIRYIVVEWRLPEGADPQQYDPPPRRMLRHLLETDERFELAASWPIRDDPAWRNVELRIYRWDAPHRSESFIEIPIPAAGRTIKVPLQREEPSGDTQPGP